MANRLRQLWTATRASLLRNLAVARFGHRSDTLWIVETQAASRQFSMLLARHMQAIWNVRAWTWSDIWSSIRKHSGKDAIRLLTEAGRLCVLNEAVEQAKKSGELPLLGRASSSNGLRRRLLSLIDIWTASEKAYGELRQSHPVGNLAEAAVVYDQYRRILERIRCQDETGLALWCSKRAGKLATSVLPNGASRIVLLDPKRFSIAQKRTLEAFETAAQEVIVTLPLDPDPALEEAYRPSLHTYSYFRTRGYEELRESEEADRPAGLEALEKRLFAWSSVEQRPAARTDGLLILGAPEGAGHANTAAGQVVELLSKGVRPSDICILTRTWDEQACVVLETLRESGVAVQSTLEEPLERSPAIEALLLAASLPASDWEVESLVRVLRHGRMSRASSPSPRPYPWLGRSRRGSSPDSGRSEGSITSDRGFYPPSRRPKEKEPARLLVKEPNGFPPRSPWQPSNALRRSWPASKNHAIGRVRSN